MASPVSLDEDTELLAKLVDVVCSLGGSNHNPQSLAMPAASSLRPLGVSSYVPVIAPEAVLVASSFAADLNRNRDREGGALDGVKDVLRDDDDDDMEPATIADDSDDDIARSIPIEGGGASSLETQ
ncbi:hypothetical protein Ahy_B09g095273 [Arachis hypogaea]|uniref:Uncharacterized protein n=1 Tax=Arachis hypogaea TaxID=3818 RepID=A0A444XDD6_ARAHY|nr:hypothetical protein Ahy_B09g095273 [Arachis hypogaea]